MVAVVHDVIVEVFLVMERPAGGNQCCDENSYDGALAVLFCFSDRGRKILNHVRDGKGCDKGHRRQHYKAIALVDFDAEISRNVFENDICLDVI